MKILSATTKTQGSQINTHIILKCICGKGYADALSILTGPGEVGATSPWKFPHALPPIPYRDIRIHTTSHTHTQSTTLRACRIKSPPSIQVPLQLGRSFPFQSHLLRSPPHSQPDGVAVLDTHVTVAPALPSSPMPPPLQSLCIF